VRKAEQETYNEIISELLPIILNEKPSLEQIMQIQKAKKDFPMFIARHDLLVDELDPAYDSEGRIRPEAVPEGSVVVRCPGAREQVVPASYAPNAHDLTRAFAEHSLAKTAPINSRFLRSKFNLERAKSRLGYFFESLQKVIKKFTDIQSNDSTPDYGYLTAEQRSFLGYISHSNGPTVDDSWDVPSEDAIVLNGIFDSELNVAPPIMSGPETSKLLHQIRMEWACLGKWKNMTPA